MHVERGETVTRKTAMRQDAYAVQMARQNAGLCCEECSSFQGHTVLCPLINRESAEIRSAERAQPKPEPQFSEADTLRLHGWGITL
jgi:hypothetical protein